MPLSEIGLRVKRPENVPKKTKLAPLLHADARFKWYQQPGAEAHMLSVAVESETGQLAAGSITLCPPTLLVSSSNKRTASAAARDDGGALEAAQLPPHLAQALIFVSSPQTVEHAGQVIETMLAQAAAVPWAERSGAEQPLYVIGLDTEWRPSFKKGEEHRTSILQLAFAQQLIIFDMHWVHSGHTRALSSQVDGLPHSSQPRTWQEAALNLLRRLLTSPCYLKLGFSFQGDLDKMFKDYSSVSLIEPFLDLQVPSDRGRGEKGPATCVRR